MKARLQIRPATYRRKRGFRVSGRDTFGRSVRIFTITQQGAKEIKTAILNGDHETTCKVLFAGR